MASSDVPTLRTKRALKAEMRERLETLFREALRSYDQSDPQASRQGAMEAIDVLLEHLEELGVTRSLARPLRDIWLALLDADRGVAHPLLKPTPVENRPPLPLWRLHIRETAALAMDLLMLDGKNSKQAAAKRVAKELNKLGVPLGGRLATADWKIVAEWRDRLSKAPGGGERYSDDWHWAGGMYLLKKETLLRHVREEGRDPEGEAMQRLAKIPHAIPPSGKKGVY